MFPFPAHDPRDGDPTVVLTRGSQMPVFQTETNGQTRRQKFIMGRRNWCSVDWDPHTGDLMFDIRVEKEKGLGDTVGCVMASLCNDYPAH